jgi:L-iditol 2-dehydrogenase
VNDLRSCRGINPAARYPLIPGHQFSGIVEACGLAVKYLEPGDRVAVHTYAVCGHCRACRTCDTHGCEQLEILGITVDGGFAEYCAVPSSCLYLLPDHVTLAQGAMVEPLANAVAAVRRSRLTTGGRAVVIGRSPIGLLALQVARLCHPSMLVSVGAIDEQAVLAERLGATHTITAEPEDAQEMVMDLMSPGGADAVIECTGLSDWVELAMAVIGWRGWIVVEGHSDPAQMVSLSPFGLLVARSVRMMGNCGWETADFVKALDLISSGLVGVDALIGPAYSLTQWEAAFEAVASCMSEPPQVQFRLD